MKKGHWKLVWIKLLMEFESKSILATKSARDLKNGGIKSGREENFIFLLVQSGQSEDCYQ